MVLIGGWNIDLGKIFNNMYVFDSANNIWKIIEKITGDEICEREAQTATLINNDIYIFGG